MTSHSSLYPRPPLPDLPFRPAMDPDRLLAHEDYNLGSAGRLAARDDPWLAVWLDGRHPLSLLYRHLRNQRLVTRKEFYETIFLLHRLRDWLGTAPPRLYDLAAGHGLVGMLAALLAPDRVQRVVAVDRRQPRSYDRLLERIALTAPYVKVRTRFRRATLERMPLLRPDGWVIGVHCCGSLTDHAAEAARAANIPFVLVPCCESRRCLPGPEQAHFGKSRGDGLVQDRVNAARVARWQQWGYTVEERALPRRITDRTRIFLCRPMVGVGV